MDKIKEKKSQYLPLYIRILPDELAHSALSYIAENMPTKIGGNFNGGYKNTDHLKDMPVELKVTKY